MKHILITAILIFQLTALYSQATNKIDSVGNVGIGTTSPGVLLDVSASGARLRTNSNGHQLNIGEWDGTYHRIEGDVNRDLLITSYSNLLRLGMAGATHMSINTSGYIGIGTTSPAYRLDVNGAAQFSGVIHSTVPIGPFLNAISGTTGEQFLNIGNSNGLLAMGIENQAGGAFAIGSLPNAALINQYYAKSMQFGTDNRVRMTIDATGNIGIGTTTPSEKLSVNGNIRTKKVIVTRTNWSDYVFDEAYKLKPLAEVAQFIKQNKHLPEIPSAKEVIEKGVDLGDNQALLLRKIEELTLYVIQQQKEINELKRQISRK